VKPAVVKASAEKNALGNTVAPIIAGKEISKTAISDMTKAILNKLLNVSVMSCRHDESKSGKNT
jgi:hypothetical protein